MLLFCTATSVAPGDNAILVGRTVPMEGAVKPASAGEAAAYTATVADDRTEALAK